MYNVTTSYTVYAVRTYTGSLYSYSALRHCMCCHVTHVCRYNDVAITGVYDLRIEDPKRKHRLHDRLDLNSVHARCRKINKIIAKVYLQILIRFTILIATMDFDDSFFEESVSRKKKITLQPYKAKTCPRVVSYCTCYPCSLNGCKVTDEYAGSLKFFVLQ